MRTISFSTTASLSENRSIFALLRTDTPKYLISIRHQVSHSALECPSQLLDCGDRHVPLTAFDHAHECAVQIGVHAEGFLR